MVICISIAMVKPSSSSGVNLAAPFPIITNINGDAINGKPGIGFDGINFLCVWKNGNDIYGTRISPDGEVIDITGIPISTGLNQSVYPPSVAFDGANYFVVWCAARNGVSEIYGARVAPSGEVLDPQGIQITSGSNTEIRMPGIAFDGAHFLVVWRTKKDDPVNGNNIYGTLVSKSGANLGPNGGFPIAQLGRSCYPAVAFGGTQYVVAWYDGRNYNWDIYGARVDTSGHVIDPNGFAICSELHDQAHPMVAFDGTNYLIVWYDCRPQGSDLYGSAYGARVSPTGSVLDNPSFKIADHVRGQGSVQLAFDGTNYLAIWHVQYKDVGTNWRLEDVYGKRISKDGQLIDRQGIPISTSLGHQFGPIVGFGAGRYLAAWSDGQNSGSTNSIYGRIISADAPVQNLPFENALPEEAGWSQQTVGINTFASEGLALNTSNAYLFGQGSIYHFSGDPWHYEDNFDEGSVYAAWANASNNIWLGGWAGGINHFNGLNWIDDGCQPGNIITGIWGVDNRHLWATTDKGNLIKTNENLNWNQVSTGLSFDFEDIWGAGSGNIFAVGERGSIIHYDGSGWNAVSGIPTDQTLNAIWGSGSDDVFAAGDWGAILHFDGTAWSLQKTCTMESLFDVWGFNGSDVYAVGLNGTVLHYDGANWRIEESGTNQDLLTVFGAYDTPNHVVWAAGSGQIVLRKEYQREISVQYSFPGAGWYLASLPVVPPDSAVASLFPDALGGTAFEWDPATDNYLSTAKMEPGKGYWLAFDHATACTVAGNPLYHYARHFTSQGWYLIGSVLEECDFSSPRDNPDNQLLSPVFGWDPVSETYVPVTTLNEKQGYWAAVFGECDLTVGASGGSLAKSGAADKESWSRFFSTFGPQPPAPPNQFLATGKRSEKPVQYAMFQNYPNPFNPETRIQYSLPMASHVEFMIFDITGRLVRALKNDMVHDGVHEIVWDSKNDNGNMVPSGIYFIRLTVDEKVFIKKITIMK
jgi:hypothetical protein